MAQKTSDMFIGIGARLAITRNETGLSQTDMAKEIGVSLRAYHSYEKGERGLPIEALVLLFSTIWLYRRLNFWLAQRAVTQ